MVSVLTSTSVSESETRAVWAVYAAVFGDVADERAWRAATWDRHTARDGFRLVRALDGDRLVGFAYGYTGEHGQWWTDHARQVLAPAVADRWLGGHFELVSLGVVPEFRGAGLGRRLLRAVTSGLDHDRLLLMATADPDDPARRLYAAEGWQVIGPGIGEGTVILGAGP